MSNIYLIIYLRFINIMTIKSNQYPGITNIESRLFPIDFANPVLTLNKIPNCELYRGCKANILNPQTKTKIVKFSVTNKHNK